MVSSHLAFTFLLVIFATGHASGWVRNKEETTEEVITEEVVVTPTGKGETVEKAAFDTIFEINSKAGQPKNLGDKKSLLADNKEAMIEGDIIYTKDVKTYIDSKKSNPDEDVSPFDAITNGQWPNKIMYYQFSRSFSSGYRSIVRQAMNHIKQRVKCLRFVERTNQRDYAEFIHDGGCYSMIGRQGGRQPISLGNGCGQLGVAIHEIMHALGFYHEQSRRDRDSYIKINFGNIPRSVWYNFEKYRAGQASTLGEPYDKSSVMHYGNYAFSNNGRKTIESRSNPNEKLGQRNGLSTIDIKQLNKYYGCDATTTTKKPVVPVQPGCKDGHSLCEKFKSVGGCKVSWIVNNCKKSCNHSSCQPKQKCENKSQYCDGWATYNQYCRLSGGCCNKSSQYRDYMNKNCRKACRFC